MTRGMKLLKNTEQSEMVNATLYQSAVGSLLYLSGWTRPDIAFSVSNVARFCSSPTKEHWTAVKRIFRYLKGTHNYGLLYSRNDGTMIGYLDADWAGDMNDRKSTSGYLFMMSGAAVSWKSRKMVALSTVEAEYIALASTTQKTTWMRQLLEDLHNRQIEPTVIHEDNQSAIYLHSPEPAVSQQNDIKHHFVREKVSDNTIKLKYCPISDILADILTKRLTYDKFSRLRQLSGPVCPQVRRSIRKRTLVRQVFLVSLFIDYYVIMFIYRDHVLVYISSVRSHIKSESVARCHASSPTRLACTEGHVGNNYTSIKIISLK